MPHSLDTLIGLILGIITGIAFFALIVMIAKKGKICKNGKYDERQLLVRSKAYQIAFIVLILYLVINGMINSVLGIQWCDSFMGSLLGIFLSIMVFAIFCIFHDAYVSFQEKPTQSISLFAVIAVANFGIGFINFDWHHDYIVNGQLSYHALNFICGILMIIIILALLIKRGMDKKSAALE